MCYLKEQAKEILQDADIKDLLIDVIQTGIGGAWLDSCPARFESEKDVTEWRLGRDRFNLR